MTTLITRLVAISAFALTIASCTVNDIAADLEETAYERIDLVISEPQKESVFLQSSSPADLNDLISFNTYEGEAGRVDISVNLDPTRELVFSLTHRTVSPVWTVEEGFSLHPTRDLDDKLKFVTVELTQGSEGPSYSSNIGDEFPRTIHVDVFRIIDFDPVTGEIFCRMKDLPLAEISGSGIAYVNGTFRGKLEFLGS